MIQSCLSAHAGGILQLPDIIDGKHRQQSSSKYIIVIQYRKCELFSFCQFTTAIPQPPPPPPPPSKTAAAATTSNRTNDDGARRRRRRHRHRMSHFELTSRNRKRGERLVGPIYIYIYEK